MNVTAAINHINSRLDFLESGGRIRNTALSRKKTNQLFFQKEGNCFSAWRGRKCVYSEYTFNCHPTGFFSRGYIQQVDGRDPVARAILRAAGSLNPHGGWYTVAFSPKGKPFMAFRNHLGILREETF